jgi:hypothetical protein
MPDPTASGQPTTTEPLVCPQCRKPVLSEPPAQWITAYGPLPQSCHLDGQPLCPVPGPDGYHPADPVPVENVYIVTGGTLVIVHDDLDTAQLHHTIMIEANLDTYLLRQTPPQWDASRQTIADRHPDLTVIDARPGRDLATSRRGSDGSSTDPDRSSAETDAG